MGHDEVTLALTEATWKEIAHALDLRVESAAVLVARSATTRAGRLLLGRQLHWVPDEHYTARQTLRLSIRSQGYVPALGAAAQDGASAIFLHTHPGGDPAPSLADEVVDDELRSVFGDRTRTDRYVSLIVGGTSDRPRFSGRVYEPGSASPRPLTRLRIVGGWLSITRTDATSFRQPESVFDRQVQAFGRSGQAILRSIRVGIVGAGGTGSAVYEQLVRLGVADIVVVDDDVIDDHNVTRIHESDLADIGRPKVEVLEQRGRDIGLGTGTTAIRKKLRSPEVVAHLTDRDVVFGCTDDDFGRAVLSRLAYWYLIPVFDMGVVVDSDARGINDVFGRVTFIAPGSPCLLCRGRVDASRLAWDSLTDAERRGRVHEGYVPELAEAAPSVISYTSLVASMAVSEMLTRLFRLGEPDPPSEILIRVVGRAISRNASEPKRDHFCSDPATWGRGDEVTPLGWIWPV